MEQVRIGFIGAGGLAASVRYPSVVEIEDASIEAIFPPWDDMMGKGAQLAEMYAASKAAN